MTWGYIVAAVTGFLLGFMFRIPALIVSSTLIGLCALAAGLIGGRPALAIGFTAAGLLCAHQGAYIAGLLFQHFWSRHHRQSGKS